MSMLRFKYHSTPPNYKFVQQQPSGHTQLNVKTQKLQWNQSVSLLLPLAHSRYLKKSVFNCPPRGNLSQRLQTAMERWDI